MRIRTHPGEMLVEEFLKPLNLTVSQLADLIDVPQDQISDIVTGRLGVTADTALRLGQHFGTTAELWTNAQAAHDLSVATDNG
jgi:addiction module HigA family antidote